MTSPSGLETRERALDCLWRATRERGPLQNTKAGVFQALSAFSKVKKKTGPPFLRFLRTLGIHPIRLFSYPARAGWYFHPLVSSGPEVQKYVGFTFCRCHTQKKKCLGIFSCRQCDGLFTIKLGNISLDDSTSTGIQGTVFPRRRLLGRRCN